MPEAEGGGIFVSYRRQETSGLAGRLSDRLADRFGEGQVFIDVDAIEPGVDFAEEINRAVAACQVLLAVIGPKWLTATDERGRRRLDDPDDIVRLEIEAALTRNVRVIPILVEGAVMPGRQDLPESLAGLASRNALSMRHESFRYDAGRLVTAIERALDATPGAATVPRASGAHAAEHERKPARPQQQPATTDMIETMLRRLEASRSASPYLRDTVAKLRAMGYELSLPKPHPKTGELEPYIKVIDPASPRAAVAYMRAGFLIFRRPSDQDVLRKLPGVIVRDVSGVKFAIDGQHELEAARKVKR
jgi:hypothetical protein